MIEILIVVVVILLIWKWSTVKPYLESINIPLLGDAEKNSEVAHNTAINNVQELYRMQDSISEQLQSTLVSVGNSANTQSTAVQATYEAAQFAQKISVALKDSIASTEKVPDLQDAIDIMETAKKAITQSTALAEHNQTVMNSQIKIANALITSSESSSNATKAIIDDLSNQITLSSTSISTAMDNATKKANEILTKGDSIQKQLNEVNQLLISLTAQGKLLIPQFIASMQTLSQVYKTINIIGQQYDAFKYLMYGGPYSIMSEHLYSKLPTDIAKDIKDIVTVFFKDRDDIGNMIKEIHNTIERVNINGLDHFYMIMTWLTKGSSISLYDKVEKYLADISGFINPIQNAILTANSLQSNAENSRNQLGQAGVILIDINKKQSTEIHELAKNVPSIQLFVNSAIEAQQQVANAGSYLPSLQEELSNAILAKQSASNARTQREAQATVQNIIIKIHPVFQNIINNLREASVKQGQSTLQLKMFSDSVNRVQELTDLSKNNLSNLNSIIDKSKKDTQSAISQAQAVQEFIVSFISYINDRSGYIDLTDIDDMIKDIPREANKAFDSINIKDLADKSLELIQSVAKNISVNLDKFLNITTVITPSIVGIRPFYMFENATNIVKVTLFNFNPTTKKEEGILEYREFPMRDYTPTNIKSFSPALFLEQSANYKKNNQNTQLSFVYKAESGQFWDNAKSGEYKCPNANGVDIKGDSGNFANYCIFTGDDGEKYAQEYCNTDVNCAGYVKDVRGKIQLIHGGIGLVEDSSKPSNNFYAKIQDSTSNKTNIQHNVSNDANVQHSVSNDTNVQSSASNNTSTTGSATSGGFCDTTGKCTTTTCQNGACTTKVSYASSTRRQCVNNVCTTTKCSQGQCVTTTEPAKTSFINRRKNNITETLYRNYDADFNPDFYSF